MLPKKDMVILSHLRKNARMGLTEMSRSSRVPVSTLHDRLKTYAGTYIHRNTALLNFASLGFTTRVSILLRIGTKDKEAVRATLSAAPMVNSLYKINNGYDFLAECVFRTMRDLEDFIERLEQQHDVKAKQVFFVIDDLKREAFLADPQLLDLVNPAVPS